MGVMAPRPVTTTRFCSRLVMMSVIERLIEPNAKARCSF
jgi:hypothetical protein